MALEINFKLKMLFNLSGGWTDPPHNFYNFYPWARIVGNWNAYSSSIIIMRVKNDFFFCTAQRHKEGLIKTFFLLRLH